MKIHITNFTNAATVSFPVILIQGSIENFTQDVWTKHSRSSYVVMMHRKVCLDSNENDQTITEVPMIKLKFKVLIQLHIGENDIKFEFLGVKDSLRISYQPVSFSHRLR